MTTRRWGRAVVAGLLAALTLTGCGLGPRVVGVHPPATESVGGAPLTEPTAQAIATRALTEARAAEGAQGAAGTAARKAALTGSALVMAEAAVSGKAAVAPADQLATVKPPTVLAMTKGVAWPRTMLVTTSDGTGVQQLIVLVSPKPTSPFVVSAIVPMLSGAVVPSLGTISEGTTLVTDGQGLVAAPKDVLTAYAAALGYPKPAATKVVALKDTMSTSLAAAAAAQAKAFGPLASLTQQQAALPEHTLAIRLADGGALVFGVLKRTDTITPAKTAKEVVLPAPVAALAGKSKVTKSVTTTTYATVALVVPTTGQAIVVAADEQLAAAKGT